MGLGRDLRFALRMLWSNRGFSLVVILALALGIGANATVFTLVNAVLFKDLPFPNADRLVVVNCNLPSKGETRIGVSLPDYEDWQAQSHAFQALAAVRFADEVITDAHIPPQSFNAAYLSPNALATIGVRPVRGRDFTAADAKPGAAPVAMVSYSVWQNVFDFDPGIIGRRVLLNRSPATIIAVLPAGFGFPQTQEIWMPLVPLPSLQARDDRELLVFGRMPPGQTMNKAQAEMNLVAKRLAGAYAADKGVTIGVNTFDQEFNGGSIRLILLTLLGAVGCVLVIACANVSNLLLARALNRGREIGIRAALGAGRGRIVRQLLVESVIMAILGGAVGLVLAIGGVHAFALAVARIPKPSWIDFSMDYTVYGYLALICVATGLLFGMAPALHATRGNLVDTLKAGSPAGGRDRGATWFSRGMVVIELALALLLLIGAGLLLRSFGALYGLVRSLPVHRIEVAILDLSGPGYPTDTDRQDLAERLLTRLRNQPGVAAAALASRLPLDGTYSWRFAVAGEPSGDPNRRPQVRIVVISPGYFQTLQQALLQGREFSGDDGLPGELTAIVNQRFAARYLTGGLPLGQSLVLGVPPADGNGSPSDTMVRIVGMAPNIHQDNENHAEADPIVYLPMRMRAVSLLRILVRGHGSVGMAATIRGAVRALDPALPAQNVMTLDDYFGQRRWPYRVFGTLFAVFAAIALALAAVGLYAVIAYSVARRTHEIGIRMALGSSRLRVLRLVLAEGVWQIGLGLALGLAAAFAATRVLASLLIGVTATDPATFAVLAAALAATALFACVIPALRAAATDPNIALRCD